MTSAKRSARIRLPDRRRSLTQAQDISGQAFTVTTGHDDAGQALEVFADGLREGAELQRLLDDACVVISLALQHGIGRDALLHSLGTMPTVGPGGPGEAPASIIGAIVAALEPIAPLPGAGG